MTRHHRSSKILRLKRQTFSSNLHENVFHFYVNDTCGMILRCQCGCSFRNLAWLHIFYMLAREAALSGMKRWTGSRIY